MGTQLHPPARPTNHFVRNLSRFCGRRKDFLRDSHVRKFFEVPSRKKAFFGRTPHFFETGEINAFAVGTPLSSQADRPLLSEKFRCSAAERKVSVRNFPGRDFYETGKRAYSQWEHHCTPRLTKLGQIFFLVATAALTR